MRILTPGTVNTVSLSWTNSLDVPLQNATISVALKGAVQPGTVQSSGGFYDSNANTITFDQSTDPSLANLAPGASGLGVVVVRDLRPATVRGTSQTTPSPARTVPPDKGSSVSFRNRKCRLAESPPSIPEQTY